MAKYQKYAEYQYSEVNGLDAIPVHWNLSKVKYLASYLNGYAFKPEHWAEFGVPIIRIQNLSNQNAEINRTEFCPLERYKVKAGDILISWSATLDVYIWNKEDAWLNQHIFKVSINKNFIDSQFFYWTAKWFMGELNESSHGSTMQHLTTDKFGSFNVPLPDIGEQKQIANFLDHETAQIDTLISKQEKLIELLKEKRQAVISHAVTKGLNPDVSMKDSGVEWLGQVPEHWGVRQLRYLGSCQNGINIGAEYFGSGSPFISYGDVYRHHELPTSFEGLVQSTENDRRIYSVQRGDVLFTRTSETIEEIGFSSTCLSDVKDATFAGFLIRFRPIQDTLLPEYSKFYFRNILLRAFFVKEMNLVTRASLSQELLKKLAVAFPNLEEQKQISDFLSAKERVFEKLINDCIKQIELLKERRTALISSAVTGKIDVRNWQAPHKNNEANTELGA